MASDVIFKVTQKLFRTFNQMIPIETREFPVQYNLLIILNFVTPIILLDLVMAAGFYHFREKPEILTKINHLKNHYVTISE